MASGEHPLPMPGLEAGPIGLAAADSVPWVRLVTGLFAFVVVLALSWRSAPPAGPVKPRAVPHPVRSQQIIARPLPELVPAAAPQRGADDLAPAAAVPHQAAPAAGSEAQPPRPPVRRTAARAHGRGHTVAAKGRTPSASYRAVVYRPLPRRRADVVREFMAAREQVAAFTGEDSGSAYLMRAAARRGGAVAKRPVGLGRRS